MIHAQLQAYNDDDRDALDKVELHWAIIVAKIDKYTDSLGGEYEAATTSDCASADTQ